jgi:hypothetical protein
MSGSASFQAARRVLIGDTGFRSIALLLKDPSRLQLSEGKDYVGAAMGFNFQHFLKILLGFGVTSSLLIG